MADTSIARLTQLTIPSFKREVLSLIGSVRLALRSILLLIFGEDRQIRNPKKITIPTSVPRIMVMARIPADGGTEPYCGDDVFLFYIWHDCHLRIRLQEPLKIL